MTGDRFSREIEEAGRRLAQARGSRQSAWHHAALIGAGGWLLAVPVVGGAYLGRWLDARQVGGGQSWTITLIVLGLAVGVYNFWSYYQRGTRR